MNKSLPFSTMLHFPAVFRSLVGLVAAVSLVSLAKADNNDLATIISSQSPTNWLQFNNNLTDIGSSPATWVATGGGFGDDADSNANSARTQSAQAEKVRTTTDVIAPAGSLSMLFRVPDIPFTGDRWLFDGGQDEFPTEDQAFQLRWDNAGDDPNGELDLRIGNTTVELNGVNLNQNLGKWFYFGVTWDDQVNTPEGYAYYGVQGGKLFETEVNPSNSSLIGDGNGFTIGNVEDDPNFFDRPWRQFEDPNLGHTPGSGTGRIDEFAIWSDRKLEPAQLQAQFEYWNGNIPSSDPNVGVFDGFSDGSRAKEPGGLNWYAIGGPTSGGTQKPGLTVRDAASEFSSDPNAGFNPALFVETIGSNNPFQAVFDDPNDASLGTAVGSTLSVSFDMTFQDGAAFPSTGQLRFGIYADTDNEFGTNGDPGEGQDPNTIWGETDGDFDKKNPGALGGDAGVYARIDIGSDPNADGTGARLYQQETVTDIIGGTGDDLIAEPDPNAGFAVLDDPSAVYNLELLLTRTSPSITGDTVELTLNVLENDILIGSLSGIDDDPNSAFELSTTDIFDYFVIKTTADADFVLDNFRLEANDATGIPGDFNGDGMVDSADFLLWQRNPAIGSLSDWEANYGLPTTSNAAAVPEPASVVLLLLCSLCGLKRNRI